MKEIVLVLLVCVCVCQGMTTDSPDETTASPTTEPIPAAPKVKTKGCIRECEREWSGHYQSCDSCTDYIVCSNGITYTYTCPKGEFWNDKTQGCDSSNATCEI